MCQILYFLTILFWCCSSCHFLRYSLTGMVWLLKVVQFKDRWKLCSLPVLHSAQSSVSQLPIISLASFAFTCTQVFLCGHLLSALHRLHDLVGGERLLYLLVLVYLVDALGHCDGHLLGRHAIILPFCLKSEITGMIYSAATVAGVQSLLKVASRGRWSCCCENHIFKQWSKMMECLSIMYIK